LVINPQSEVKKDVPFRSDYRLLDWVSDGYRKPLSEYKAPERKNYALSVRNYELIEELAEKDRIELKNSFNFFRYTISTDRKRYINKNGFSL
jgi:hypothetical protein